MNKETTELDLQWMIDGRGCGDCECFGLFCDDNLIWGRFVNSIRFKRRLIYLLFKLNVNITQKSDSTIQTLVIFLEKIGN